MLSLNNEIENQVGLKTVLTWLGALSVSALIIYFALQLKREDAQAATSYSVSGNCHTGTNKSIMASLANGDTLLVTGTFVIFVDCNDLSTKQVVIVIKGGTIEFKQDKSFWLGTNSKIICSNGGNLSVEAGITGSNSSSIYFNSVQTITPNGGTGLYSFSQVNAAGGYDHGGGNLLPVDLIAFTATKDGNGTWLKWSTASEENNSHFDVERSEDGQTFNKISEVNGAGMSTVRIDYQYFDHFEKSSGAVLYRLKQVDFDGTTDYSPVRVVQSDAPASTSKVYPNPVNDLLNVEYMGEEYDLELADLNGNLMYSMKKAPEQTTINTTGLPNGYYLVRLFRGTEVSTHKIRVQH